MQKPVRDDDVERCGTEAIDERQIYCAGEELTARPVAPACRVDVVLALVEADVVDVGRELGQDVGWTAADVQNAIAGSGHRRSARAKIRHWRVRPSMVPSRR